MLNRLLFVILVLINSNVGVNAQQSAQKKRVYQFEILSEIAPEASRKTERAIREAQEFKADLILLRLNTYGGLVDDADKIRTAILNSPIPVYVWIENNAASAGALISISCHKIFMSKGSNIGAASVVDGSGNLVPDKYQSYMRSKMRATAEARGRNPDVAEAMVDGDRVVPGLNDSGKVVTLTQEDALKWGFCDGKANSLEEVLRLEKIAAEPLMIQQESWVEKAIGFLAHPGVSGVLIFLILGGIYYELRTPGIGFPLVVSIASALLYFAPLYLEGLATHWEILVFIAGLGLLAVEIFVIPGFGVAGISGLVCIFGALVLSAINNVNFDFSGTDTDALNTSLLKVALALVAFIALIVFTGSGVMDSLLRRKLALADELTGKAPEQAPDQMIGEEAVCHGDLKPQGEIRIGHKLFPASTKGHFLSSGTRVRITGRQGFNYLVEPIQE